MFGYNVQNQVSVLNCNATLATCHFDIYEASKYLYSERKTRLFYEMLKRTYSNYINSPGRVWSQSKFREKLKTYKNVVVVKNTRDILHYRLITPEYESHSRKYIKLGGVGYHRCFADGGKRAIYKASLEYLIEQYPNSWIWVEVPVCGSKTEEILKTYGFYPLTDLKTYLELYTYFGFLPQYVQLANGLIRITKKEYSEIVLIRSPKVQ